MAGQIQQWMKDGGVDLPAILNAIGKSGAANSPLQHILNQFKPAVDTVIGGGKVLRDAAGVAVAPGVDAARQAVYGVAGLKPNDPNAYTDESLKRLGQSSTDLAAPTRQAFGSIGDFIKQNLAKSGTPLVPEAAAADVSVPTAAPTEAPPIPTRAAIRQRQNSGALTATPGSVAVPEDAVGALPQSPVQTAQAPGTPAPTNEQLTHGKTLADMFKERMDQIPQVEYNKLDASQKQQLLLQFSLGLMARGGTPGNHSFLGNVGDAGMDTLQSSRILQHQNNLNMVNQRTAASENAYREAGLADRDMDNKTQARRFDIMEKRLSQGKWGVHETQDGNHVLLDDQGNTKPLPPGLKLKSKDNKGATIELLEHLRKNPKDLALYKTLNAKTGDDSDTISQKDFVKMVIEHNKGGSDFEPRTMEESTAAINKLLGRGGTGAPTGTRPTGDASIAHMPPAVQKQAQEIKNLVNTGKMTREQALQKLKSIGL